MRALVQRVHRAHVVVAGDVVGEIDHGILALVGVTHDDTSSTAGRLADKLAHLRIMADAAGRMDRSVVDVGGGVLVVSQFTLYGDTRRGRRPSWGAAAGPEAARPLVEAVATGLRARGLEVATGRFGAEMDVHLVNDGPVTLLVEVDDTAGGALG